MDLTALYATASRNGRLSALLWGTLSSIVGEFESASHISCNFIFTIPNVFLIIIYSCLTKKSYLKLMTVVRLNENTVPCWVLYFRLRSYCRGCRWCEDGNRRRSYVGRNNTLWVGQPVKVLVAGNTAESLLLQIQQIFGHKYPDMTSPKTFLAQW